MKKKIIEWFAVEAELGKAKSYPGFAFQVWCTINEKKLKEQLDVVREKSNPTDEYKNFIQKIEDIKKELCEKDKEGNPIIDENKYTFSEKNRVKLETKIDELNKENGDIIKEYTDKINEYFAYIRDEDLDIDIKLLNEKNIPEKYFEEHPDLSVEFIQSTLDLIKFED